MVLNHVTIVDTWKCECMCYGSNVLGFGNHIVDGVGTVGTMRPLRMCNLLLETRNVLCGIELTCVETLLKLRGRLFKLRIVAAGV